MITSRYGKPYDLLTLHDDIQVIGEAADGNEAIQMVTACRPDVILMDLNMPKRNSIDATQEESLEGSGDNRGLCRAR